ncbi:MAG: N-acetylmuramoyl-L-alanine amidase [Solirubrobacteraceae bacterium]
MSWEPDRLTRRAVLRGAAVAGAAALVRPGVSVAASRPVFSRYVGRLAAGETAPIEAPRAFTLVGVQWSEPAAARIELRTRQAGGRWSPWVSASVRGHDPDGPPGDSAGQFGEPIWTGAADVVQLRAAGAVDGVQLHFVAELDPGAGSIVGGEAHVAQAFPLAQPNLDAGPGQPPIIARSAWARGHAPPRHAPEYGTVKVAFVHHSVTANGYGPGQVPSILRSIFVYHRYVRGYFDIAYNFAVDDFGRIWEGRAGGVDQAVIGAHAGGYNTESTGMVVLGNFAAVAPPPAAINALQQLLAWKLALHGVPALGRVPVLVSADGAPYTSYAPGSYVSLPRIAGHRDGDQTSCPGDALYARLPAIRPRVAGLAGSPARLSIAAPVPAQPPGAMVTITGRLSDLRSGAPLAGAPVEVQQITGTDTETTIATLTTDTNGDWSYTIAPAQNTLLRALHRPAPASVSDIVVLAVAPMITVTVVSTAPLTVTGTVAPAGPPVTVDLYRVLKSGRRKLVKSRQLAASGGQFTASFRGLAPGRYVLLAGTAASTRYAAGAAPATPVVI